MLTGQTVRLQQIRKNLKVKRNLKFSEATFTFGGSLELFAPKILEGSRDLRIIILLEKECSFSGADNVRWWGHSNTTRW